MDTLAQVNPHSTLHMSARIIDTVLCGQCGDYDNSFSMSIMRAYDRWLDGKGRFTTKQGNAMIKLADRWSKASRFQTMGALVDIALQEVLSGAFNSSLEQLATMRYSDRTGKHIKLMIGDYCTLWESDDLTDVKAIAGNARDNGSTVKLRWVH